ncbi:MAG: hypothetical protein U0166_20880 [Acidobacteriota bacterium]
MNSNQHTFTEFVEPAPKVVLDERSTVTATGDPERAARLQCEMEEAMRRDADAREELDDACGCMPRRRVA